MIKQAPQPLAYQLGYNDAARATDPNGPFAWLDYNPNYDPETEAHTIRNSFSHPDIQIPQFIAGAREYLALTDKRSTPNP